MRYLIDGYNVMYEGGLLNKRLGPDGFRRVRTRFLNDLAAALGPFDARETTVVFDAATAPVDAPRETRHQGISVIYAVDDENADARIEQLIAGHSAPKSLSVVSTDRRVRQAATRRKARSVSADAFWVELSARRQRKARQPVPTAPSPDRPRGRVVDADESAFWLHEFRGLDCQAETHAALNNAPPLLTDAEVAEIEREVDREPD